MVKEVRSGQNSIFSNIKQMIAQAKVDFNKKKTILCSNFVTFLICESNVLCLIWSVKMCTALRLGQEKIAGKKIVAVENHR